MQKIVLLFPGQGSQYIGMGSSLYEEFSAARHTFEEANDVLGFDLKRLCFEGDLEALTRTENTQPALLTVSMAFFRVYMDMFGIKPECAMGHSLGEISALTCAGAIAFPDALQIVRKRGLLMQEAVSEAEGAMAAVSGIDDDTINECCQSVSTNGQLVVISAYNAPSQIVVSGHKSAVSRLGNKLEAQGAIFTLLNVSAPFHSPLMNKAAQQFKKELGKYTFREMDWDIISNVTALPYKGKIDIVTNLTSQITQPVRWQCSMRYLEERRIDTAVEIGPKAVLKKILGKNTRDINGYSFDVRADIEELDKTWRKIFSSLISATLASAVACRNRNQDNQEYQEGVIEPYEKIAAIQDELGQNNTFPTVPKMQIALKMLFSIFATKKVPVHEQVKRFQHIFADTGTRDLFPDFKIPTAGEMRAQSGKKKGF